MCSSDLSAGKMQGGASDREMPSFEGRASNSEMTLFEGGASAGKMPMKMPSFKVVASDSKMPLFKRGASDREMPSFEGGASDSEMPSFKGGASSVKMPTKMPSEGMTTKGYQRHNPRACKKKARGGVGSRSLFKKKAPHVSTPVSAGLTTLPSEGSLPCITPLPMKPHDVILQLKRKVKNMESQALKWNDRLIELEVSVTQKDSVIEKHIKRTRLMNEEMSHHKKAHNLVSSILGLSSSLIYCSMSYYCPFHKPGFVFTIAGT